MLDKVSSAKIELDGDLAVEPDRFRMAASQSKDAANSPAKTVGMAILQAILVVSMLMASIYVANKMIASKPEKNKRPAFKTVYTINTVTAQTADHQPTLTVYGQTVAARNVELRALVAGEIVQVNPKLRAGSRVAKGDVLVTIDDFNYRGALAEAQANLVEAEAKIVENDAQINLEKSKLKSAEDQLEFARADLKRTESLRSRGTSTQQQLDERRFVVSQREQSRDNAQNMIKVQEARIGQLEASIARLKWGVRQAQRNLESTVLVAPFSGIVRSSDAEIGRNITANDVVVSLYEADSLEVQFTLTDAQYGRLQTSERGLVDRNIEIAWTVGGKQYTYPAIIDRVGAEITSSRGGVEMYARVSDITSGVTIRPGAFVEVRVPDIVFSNTISIPDTALYGASTVYTAVDGKLVENKVEVAAYEGENVLIAKGLNPGDEVLITAITEVSEGLAVRREGETEPRRGNQGGDSTVRTGRLSPEERAKILESSGVSADEFRALPQEARRKLVQKYRAENAASN